MGQRTRVSLELLVAPRPVAPRLVPDPIATEPAFKPQDKTARAVGADRHPIVAVENRHIPIRSMLLTAGRTRTGIPRKLHKDGSGSAGHGSA
jgi:hypothetical protein